MKVRALLTGLLVIACLHTHAVSANRPDMCCFNFYEHKIPVNVITKYETTRSECPKAGVIFTTRKRARICADPHRNWVKEAMKKNIDRANKTCCVSCFV
uniref:C-C motif chemokine n=1 Tax=Electrophorus electricus TaxID=8005 RepID=A0A4W4EVL7_ELEEL